MASCPSQMRPVPYLDADAIRAGVPIADMIDAVEAAYRDVANGRDRSPLRSRVELPNGDLLLMPGVREGAAGASVKLVTVTPANAAQGSPDDPRPRRLARRRDREAAGIDRRRDADRDANRRRVRRRDPTAGTNRRLDGRDHRCRRPGRVAAARGARHPADPACARLRPGRDGARGVRRSHGRGHRHRRSRRRIRPRRPFAKPTSSAAPRRPRSRSSRPHGSRPART